MTRDVRGRPSTRHRRLSRATLGVAITRSLISGRRAGGLGVLFALLLFLGGGCVAGGNDPQLRDELRAFADLSSSRVARVADESGRDSNDLTLRARLNGEKIRTANMGIENASHPHAMTGLLDMVFQFDVKARKANERVERVTTRPSDDPSSTDRFAQNFAEAHNRNRADIWAIADRRLNKTQQRGLRQLIDQWYDKNGQTERTGIRITELKSFAGNDPAENATISLVDLRESNEQVDRAMWMAQKLYENSHWQVRQFIYDVAREIEGPRNESLDALTDALGEARDDALLHIGPWVLGVVSLFLLLNVLTLIVTSRNRREDRRLIAAVAQLLARRSALPPADWPIDRPTARPTPDEAATREA